MLRGDPSPAQRVPGLLPLLLPLGDDSLRFTMRPDELERRLQERLDALGPAPRAELLHVLMLPDLERADRMASSGETEYAHLPS